MTVTYHVGDTRQILATLPAGSVDLILSSPPFYALRSYLPAGHPDKAHEIGSEQSPGEFIDTLLDVTEACARVLAPHGSLAFELGDTYATSGGPSGDSRRVGDKAFMASGRVGMPAPTGRGSFGLLDKSLCLIPELFRIALAYGRNPLTGRETDRWRVRNVVRWHRPNPPVGALGDKFRPATSDMVVACKARDRWFDLDAVRDAPSEWTKKYAGGTGNRDVQLDADEGVRRMDRSAGFPMQGAPPLDTWTIPTAPYKGAHYATWPPQLCVRPILSMCPERVCTTCGKPSRRIVGDAEYVPSAPNRGGSLLSENERVAEGVNQWRGQNGSGNASVIRSAPTLGWTDCGHDTWRRGIVLDPFAGTGTTLAAAEGHGRDSIGIDLDPRNLALAQDRVGMFLNVAP